MHIPTQESACNSVAAVSCGSGDICHICPSASAKAGLFLNELKDMLYLNILQFTSLIRHEANNLEQNE